MLKVWTVLDQQIGSSVSSDLRETRLALESFFLLCAEPLVKHSRHLVAAPAGQLGGHLP